MNTQIEGSKKGEHDEEENKRRQKEQKEQMQQKEQKAQKELKLERDLAVTEYFFRNVSDSTRALYRSLAIWRACKDRMTRHQKLRLFKITALTGYLAKKYQLSMERAQMAVHLQPCNDHLRWYVIMSHFALLLDSASHLRSTVIPRELQRDLVLFCQRLSQFVSKATAPLLAHP